MAWDTAIVAFDMDGSTLLESLEVKPEKPHITLVFMGRSDELDREEILKRIEDFSAVHAPISLKYTGIGRFLPEENGVPVVALFDSPDLPAFRQAIVNALSGMIMNQNHGFIPHMTLEYEVGGHPQRAYTIGIDYAETFDNVSVYWGDETYTYPLSGDVVEKQLPIGDVSKSRLIEVRTQIFNDLVDQLSEDVFAGRITIGQWEERMKVEIKALHSSTAVIGKGGWDEMTQSDWGKVGAAVKSQYRYLHGFAETISDKRDEISLKAIQARSRMYGNAGVNTAAVAQAGEFAGGTKRQPGRFPGLPWMPGDGTTRCLTNCRCHWELLEVSRTKAEKLIQATWIVDQEAENCDDCLKRNNHVEIRNVPLDTEVPSIIGIA